MTDCKLKILEHYGFGPNVMKRAKVCPHCRAIVPSGSPVCPDCGLGLMQTTLFDSYCAMHVRCEKCGAVLSADSQFCPDCGRRRFAPSDGGQ